MYIVILGEVINFKEIVVNPEIDLLTAIINEQENGFDPNRFYLDYLPQESLNEYDLNDTASLKKFRNLCFTFKSPIKPMCACNLTELSEDIRDYGLKISDPYGNIVGVFDIRNNIITYSPIFPLVYEERDIVKYANTRYFTTMTFKEIMEEQISIYSNFYVHTGNYLTLKDIIKNGRYILQKVDKNRMLKFVTNPDEGTKIFEKYIHGNR
jgi:hypothetical protein